MACGELLGNGAIEKIKRENCFDFLRYFFAISLIIAHFCTATSHPQLWWVSGGMCVRAFFVMAGFLVGYSYLRRGKDITTYAKKRFVRIVPAYLVCVVFCLVLGCLVSSLPFPDFISDRQTLRYTIANLLTLNFIEPNLPCTFQANTLPYMNASLWTTKFECLFYVLVPILIWMMRNRRLRDIICVVMTIGCVAMHNYMNVQLQYFLYFLTSMALMFYFDVFYRWKRVLIPLALLLSIPIYIVQIDYVSPICGALEPVSFPIIIIGIAYSLRWLNGFSHLENITYGLYLYHFPVMQALIHYGLADYNFPLCLAVTIVLTSILAALSWFLVEKPLMRRA